MLYFILKDQLMKQTKALIMHRESSFNMTRGGGGMSWACKTKADYQQETSTMQRMWLHNTNLWLYGDFLQKN